MYNKTLNDIAENLLYVLPMIHKRLLKITPPNFTEDFYLSRLHMGILGLIHQETLPTSEIAKRFLIPKPQMTLLINHLVDAEMVKRQTNKNDRRVIDISLTEKGSLVLEQCGERLKGRIKEMLSELSDKEQEELSLSLQKLRALGAKWEIQDKLNRPIRN